MKGFVLSSDVKDCCVNYVSLALLYLLGNNCRDIIIISLEPLGMIW